MSEWHKREGMQVHESQPYNAEPPRSALGVETRTPLDTFYSRNHGPVPEIGAQTWQLTVGGLVGAPRSFDLETLRREFPAHEVTATLQCAGARRQDLMAVRDTPGEEPWGVGAISTARWRGARLKNVLESVGLSAGVEHLAFDAPDVSEIPPTPTTFGASIPREKALTDDVILAWEMNGEPLPRLHGGPVRLVVPGYIGARSVKWVTTITAQTTPSSNYFQAVAYRLLPPETDPTAVGPGDGISLAAVPLTSDILSPEDEAHVEVGDLEVRGHAYVGDGREVARVDVSTDGGRTWQQASLQNPEGRWSWTLWSTTVAVPPGRTTLIVRAWDSAGATQPEDPAQVWNPKGYANTAWGRVEVLAGDAPSPTVR